MIIGNLKTTMITILQAAIKEVEEILEKKYNIKKETVIGKEVAFSIRMAEEVGEEEEATTEIETEDRTLIVLKELNMIEEDLEVEEMAAEGMMVGIET